MKFEPTPLNILAKLISGVIHPMLMPIFGTALILTLQGEFVLRDENAENTLRLFILGSIFVCTCLLPSIVIIILKLKGTITDIGLNNQSERRVPFIFTGICYTICYWAIMQMHIPAKLFPFSLAYPLMLGATVSVLLALIINYWFKISIHMMGIGGVTGSFIAIAIHFNQPLLPHILLLIMLAGITGFARLQLNAHTPAQVYSGFLVSAICNSALIMFL